MMKVEDYQDGIMYETLIRRAYKCDQHDKRVGSWNEPYDRIHTKVKLAIDKFLRRRINKEEKERLISLQEKLYMTGSKDKLVEFINEALDITQRHK